MKFLKIFYCIFFLFFIFKSYSITLDNSDFEFSNQCKDDLKSITKSNFNGIDAFKYKVNVNSYGTCTSDKKNENVRIRIKTDTIDRNKEIIFSFDFAFSKNPNTTVKFLEFDNWTQECKFSRSSVIIASDTIKKVTGVIFLDKNQKREFVVNNDDLTKIGEWNTGTIKLSPSKDKDVYLFTYTQNKKEILNTEIFIGDCAEVEFALGPQQKYGEGQNYEFYLSKIVSPTGISECDALKDLSSELKILFVSASTLSYRKKVGEDESGCEETADYLAMELNNEVDNYAASGSGALTNNAPHKNRFDTMIAGLDLTDYDWIFLGAGVGLLYTGDNQQAYQVTNQLLNSKADQGLLIRKFKDFHENGGKLILGMPTQFSQKNKDKKYHRLLKSGFELIDRIKILAKNRKDVFFVGFQDNLINPDDESFYDKKFDGVHLTPEGHKLVAQKIAEIIKNN